MTWGYADAVDKFSYENHPAFCFYFILMTCVSFKEFVVK